MTRNERTDEDPAECPRKASLLEQVTPLAREINCLDIDHIADVCVNRIPQVVGSRFASLYALDETNGILHLIRHNHPFPINRIVSLNQNPPSPMVMAVKSKGLILTGNIDTHTKPVIRRSQRTYAENYETRNCAIVPLDLPRAGRWRAEPRRQGGRGRVQRRGYRADRAVRSAHRRLDRQYPAVREDAAAGDDRWSDRADEPQDLL